MRLHDKGLQQLFHAARTDRAWLPREVPDDTLREVVTLAQLGPTANNGLPARFTWVKSKAAKERLLPHLSEGNRDKTMKAPATAIIGYDIRVLCAPAPRSGSIGRVRRQTRRGGRLLRAQRLPARRVSHNGRPRARPRRRTHVGFQQRGRGRGVFRRHGSSIEFLVQCGIRRSGRAAPARAPLRLRGGGADPLGCPA